VADFTDSKSIINNAYPVQSVETSNLLSRIEPLLTPPQLISRYLKGVPLPAYTDEELKDEIMRAINKMELMTNLVFTRTQFQETMPYDDRLYKNSIHTVVNRRPVISVEELGFINADQNDPLFYKIPAKFIAMGLAHRGQINITPYGTFFGGASNNNFNGSSGFVGFWRFLDAPWHPQALRIKYTSGLCKNDGDVPVVINEIIGMTAAIDILSARQNLNSYTSQSLNQDGLGQSSGSSGPQIYQARIEFLHTERERMINSIKNIFFQKRFVSNF